MKLTPVQYVIANAKRDVIISSIIGDSKAYAQNHKILAEMAVKHFDEFNSVRIQKISVPLFSYEGFNMLKVMIKDIFRKKTPEEKLLKKMIYKSKVKNYYNITY